MVKYRLKITDILIESEDTWTFLLEMPEDFNWEEGSQAHIGIEGYDFNAPKGTFVRHMSIMTLPEEGKIGFTTRKRGELSVFKETLFNMKVGQELLVFKPGSRMALRRENRPLVLLSMGVGIATMRPLILQHHNNPMGIKEVYQINVDAGGNFLYQKEFESMADSSVKHTWLRGRNGLDEVLERVLSIESPIFYLVGSDAFVIQRTHWLMEHGVAFQDIVVDKKEQFISRMLMMSPKDFQMIL